MKVVDAGRWLVAAGWGQCGVMRLLHFAAALLPGTVRIRDPSPLRNSSYRTLTSFMLDACQDGTPRFAEVCIDSYISSCLVFPAHL